MMARMIDHDLLRTHNEALLQAVEPHLSPTTGWLHCSSGWHPQPTWHTIPLAENFLLTLLWCKSKRSESILQARNHLQRLLRWSNPLFVRSLDQLGQAPCVSSNRRIALVIEALLRWHRFALGEIAQTLEEKLRVVSDSLEPIEPCGDGASYTTLDLVSAFGSHLGRPWHPNLSERLRCATSSWQEPCWLEKPWAELAHSESVLEVWQRLAAGKRAPCGLSQLWSGLIHETGSALPLPQSASSPYHSASRHRDPPIQPSGFLHSCFYYLQSVEGLHLTMGSEVAAAWVHSQRSGCWEIELDYQPQADRQTELPLLWIHTEDPKGWRTGKGSQANFFPLKQLMEEGIEHACYRVRLRLLDAGYRKSGEFEPSRCELPGYFYQQLRRRLRDPFDQQPSRWRLAFLPLDLGKSAYLRLQLVLC